MKSATTTITVSTDGPFEYLDLTDDLRRAVKDAGVTDGMAVAFCAHTTCALLINEWEDGALADFRRHASLEQEALKQRDQARARGEKKLEAFEASFLELAYARGLPKGGKA